MAAEDYFPTSPGDSSDTDFEEGGVGYGSQGFDREWNVESSPRLVTCKRCGEANLHWENAQGGWRLFHQGGKLHTCSNPVLRSFPALPSRIMEETTSTFTTIKESIMDKNAVAFIRNDVRTLTVAFIDSEKNSTEEYTPEALRQRALPYQKYTYLTIDPNLQAGDWALVSVRGIIKTAYVVSVSDELSIEPNAPVTYSFIVGRVDLAPYQSLVEQNAKISDMLRTSYQSSLREGFRQTLLNGLPEDQRNSISLLLNKG